MGNGKQAAMSEQGSRHTGCADIAGQRQRGSMLVLGISTLLICLLLLGLGVNLGFWNYKKTMVADAAEAFAEPIFRNQMVYRELVGQPDTETMVEEMRDELELPERLHDVRIEFTFSRGSDEDGWTDVGGDPDPKNDSERFNRVQVLVCTPMTDVTGMFTLPGEKEICQLGEAKIEETPDCLCTGPLSNALKGTINSLANFLCGLLPLVCESLLDPILDAGVEAVCQVGNTLDVTVDFVATLLRDARSADIGTVLEGVDCLLESVVVTVDTTLVTLLGPDAIRIEYTRATG